MKHVIPIENLGIRNGIFPISNENFLNSYENFSQLSNSNEIFPISADNFSITYENGAVTYNFS